MHEVTVITHEIDTERGIARVFFDRPEKLNALTAAMWRGLATTFEELSKNAAIRVVVLDGRGGRAFSVGADIGEFEETRAGKTKALEYAALVQSGVEAIQECPHPTLAAVRGYCVGGGVEIAAACDIRLASEESRFGIPIRRLGLTVDYPELGALLRLVGPANALEMLFEGQTFGANEALTKGLVNRLVPEAEFEREVTEAAMRIATGAPLVARWHKRMVRRLESDEPLREAERTEPFAVFDSEDYRIGTRAFLEKRDPVFVGR